MITPTAAPKGVAHSPKAKKNDKWLLFLFFSIFVAAIISVVVVALVLQWLFSL
jgi:nitrate reductase NapE component